MTNEAGTMSLSEWIDRVAEPRPLYAGGSALAFTAAQAWALLAMVTGILEKRGGSVMDPAAGSRAKENAHALIELAHQDAQFFQQAWTTRTQDSWYDAIMVSVRVVELCIEGLDWTKVLHRVVPDAMQPDLSAVRLLLDGAGQGSLDNARANDRTHDIPELGVVIARWAQCQG